MSTQNFIGLNEYAKQCTIVIAKLRILCVYSILFRNMCFALLQKLDKVNVKFIWPLVKKCAVYKESFIIILIMTISKVISEHKITF